MGFATKEDLVDLFGEAKRKYSNPTYGSGLSLDSGTLSTTDDMGITGASVGEFAKVKTVDANGVPTSWETGSGGGGGADIDLGITGASVGQLAMVASVDANGKPTSWSAISVLHTLTVTCQTQDGVTVTGQTVTVRQGGPDGQVYKTASYSGQPVSFSVPEGFAYFVSVTSTLASHFNPTTAQGIVSGADVSVTLTYSDFHTIQTFPDIKAALDSDIDLTGLVGETVALRKTGGNVPMDVVDYDSTNKVVTLLASDCSAFSSNVNFEPPQALAWFENGLSAGDYTFRWNNTQVYLTLATSIPAGGQLVANNSTFKTYESQESTVTLETGTVSTTETQGATDLGQTGQGLLNHHDRVSYGSNNFGESVLLAMLNSDAAQGTILHGSTKLSRAYQMPFAGFLAGMNQEDLACVDDTVWRCSACNTYECPSELGGTSTKGNPYTVTAKFGLLSQTEAFGSYDGVADGSSILDIFVGATNDDRKRYRGTSSRDWWLRSPHPGNAYYVRLVLTSGAVGYDDASTGYAVVPACKISKSS